MGLQRALMKLEFERDSYKPMIRLSKFASHDTYVYSYTVTHSLTLPSVWKKPRRNPWFVAR